MMTTNSQHNTIHFFCFFFLIIKTHSTFFCEKKQENKNYTNIFKNKTTKRLYIKYPSDFFVSQNTFFLFRVGFLLLLLSLFNV